MFFGDIPIDQAVGALLAHSYRSANGIIRKGQILSAAHIAQMRTEGVTQVTVAKLDNDDLHEDAAAEAIANALAGDNIRLGKSATGRVNLHALHDGLVSFEPNTVHALNRVDESITLATLAQEARVITGQMVATVKIIPYAVKCTTVAQAVESITQRIFIHPVTPSTACLIQTQLPSINTALRDKTRRVTANRLVERQANIVHELRVNHAVESVMGALNEAAKLHPDLILLFGASAISDRQDIIPQAITQSGGVIEHFGMPMDPGNLLLIGRLGNIHVIGMPGCARSSKNNGLDKVLDRLACKLPVTSHWISSLGVGGLLKEMVDRPRPRVVQQENLNVSALLLAAGRSQRFGDENKLLANWNGKPLIQHALESIDQSQIEEITIITGHQSELISDAINQGRCESTLAVIHNDAYATGMASSVKKGVSALIESDAIVVCLADMPNVNSQVIDALIQTFKTNPDKAIYIPTHNGQRGNPVLVARRLFDSILSLHGDTGARVLAKQFPESVLEVPIEIIGIQQDIDTEDDLSELNTID